MAIMNNTTKTIGKTSTVLADRCEKTAKNMKALIKKADVAFVGINGVDFYFMRGQYHEVPKEVAEVLRNCGIVPEDNTAKKV